MGAECQEVPRDWVHLLGQGGSLGEVCCKGGLVVAPEGTVLGTVGAQHQTDGAKYAEGEGKEMVGKGSVQLEEVELEEPVPLGDDH